MSLKLTTLLLALALYHNIGHLQDILITLTDDRQVDKDAPNFSAFVDWHTQSEIAQTPGRLRANLRLRSEEQVIPSCALKRYFQMREKGERAQRFGVRTKF